MPRSRGRVPGATRETSMKKQAKKLVLAKETVRNLSGVDLREAAGGTTWQTTCAGCPQTNSCRFCDPDDSIDFSACAVCWSLCPPTFTGGLLLPSGTHIELGHGPGKSSAGAGKPSAGAGKPSAVQLAGELEGVESGNGYQIDPETYRDDGWPPSDQWPHACSSKFSLVGRGLEHPASLPVALWGRELPRRRGGGAEPGAAGGSTYPPAVSGLTPPPAPTLS